MGILIDQNTTRDAGVFVPFFGVPACTTTSLVTIAARTGAVIVPGVLIWDSDLRKHRLRFEPPVELVHTGNPQQDIVENTVLCNQTSKAWFVKYPDQWLWVHRRWKTRPEGERDLYSGSKAKGRKGDDKDVGGWQESDGEHSKRELRGQGREILLFRNVLDSSGHFQGS